MRQRADEGEAERLEANRATASLAGLAMVLALVVAGLFLVHHLHDKAALEDCLMSGRTNCVQPIGQP